MSLLDVHTDQVLARVASQGTTPAYVYFVDDVRARFDELREAFGGRFEVSYAVKTNPNLALLTHIRDKAVTLDVSSIAEAERAVRAGCAPEDLTFSGPAKREFELRRAVELGIGEMVCEGLLELEDLDRFAGEAGKRMPVFLRINPARVPRKFGVNMAGRASQFGVDEEDVDDVVGRLQSLKNIELTGWHIYSGTNSLSEEAIAENFGIFIELFQRFSKTHGLRPKKLIFGSGFGIPYLPTEQPLDLPKLAGLINPMIDEMKRDPALADARCVLEMGRWLVGPNGYLLTRVITEKRSRGTDIRMCDAGFNNHLAACGMMGTVIRRNWRFTKVGASADEPTASYLLVGPLCTTIDQLASNIEMPTLQRGDVVAVGMSGAYGLSASPTKFISHPEPREFLVTGSGGEADIIEVTESTENHPEPSTAGGDVGR